MRGGVLARLKRSIAATIAATSSAVALGVIVWRWLLNPVTLTFLRIVDRGSPAEDFGASSVSLLEHDRVRAKLAENMSGERESRAGCLQQLARDRAHPYDWPNAS
jgi:hypothetical protein